MGLKNFFKKQLSSVIEWSNQPSDILFYKYQSETDEIKNASKLIIAPGQGCIVVYEGKVEAVLIEQGTFNLSTDNHPFVTTLRKIRQAFESEHKMNIYFYRQSESVNQKWGTATPIKYMDPKYNIPIELGVYGNYSTKITEPQKLFTEIVGSKNIFTASDLRSILMSRISSDLKSYFAKEKLSYQDIDSHLGEMSQTLQTDLSSIYTSLGLGITDFKVEGTSFNEETLDRINKIADMTSEAMAAAQVDLNYTELEKLKALRDAAKNEGGLAGAGLQVGAGLEVAKSIFSDKKDKTTKGSTQTEVSNDPVEQLRKLKLLLDDSIITQEDFDQKKKEILSKL